MIKKETNLESQKETIEVKKTTTRKRVPKKVEPLNDDLISLEAVIATEENKEEAVETAIPEIEVTEIPAENKDSSKVESKKKKSKKKDSKKKSKKKDKKKKKAKSKKKK